MNTIDRIAPLAVSLLIVGLVIAGLLWGASELSAALEGFAS